MPSSREVIEKLEAAILAKHGIPRAGAAAPTGATNGAAEEKGSKKAPAPAKPASPS